MSKDNNAKGIFQPAIYRKSPIQSLKEKESYSDDTFLDKKAYQRFLAKKIRLAGEQPGFFSSVDKLDSIVEKDSQQEKSPPSQRLKERAIQAA